MNRIIKIIAIPVVLVLLIASIIVIVSIDDDDEEDVKDRELPEITEITGDATGTTGKITKITVSFSDNVNVTKATIYFKSARANSWNSTSILSGSANIFIPLDSVEDWYYYVTVDDDAGNGPVGNPSTDGRIYYTITVTKDKKDLVHTVFIEEGTATWCTNCPDVAKILYEHFNEYGENHFYYVSMIEDKNDKAKSHLENDYNILGYPTNFIDGGYEVILGSTDFQYHFFEKCCEEVISAARFRDVPALYLNITAELDENRDKIEINVFAENYENETYTGRLKVYLTEIISRWRDLEGNPYHFGFLDYIINKEITIDGRENINEEKIWDVSNLDPENLMIIAVLFSSESHQAYADPPDGNPFDAYYADATAGAKVVEGGNLPPEVGITNPVQGKLHLLGYPIFKTLLKNTILIEKTLITVEASDDSKVERVEFYVDDKLVANISKTPYEWKWEKSIGSKFRHTIKVVAYDDEGKSRTDSIDVIMFILFG